MREDAEWKAFQSCTTQPFASNVSDVTEYVAEWAASPIGMESTAKEVIEKFQEAETLALESRACAVLAAQRGDHKEVDEHLGLCHLYRTTAQAKVDEFTSHALQYGTETFGWSIQYSLFLQLIPLLNRMRRVPT